MRPTWPLLALTLLQGVSWGVMAVVAAALVGGWPVSTGTVQAWEWLAWGTGALGGSASVFHMHRLAAARYVLRRLRSSWLSREALSTGGYMAVLSVAVALRVLWPQASGLWEAATLLAAGLGAVAVYITAMLYATIPAMRSWHSPLTVVVFFAAALLSGGAGAGAVGALLGGPGLGGLPGLDAAFALVFGALVSLQIRAFRVAAAGVLAATGTGLAGRPYRLQDAGGKSAAVPHADTNLAGSAGRGSHQWLCRCLGLGRGGAVSGGSAGNHRPGVGRRERVAGGSAQPLDVLCGCDT